MKLNPDRYLEFAMLFALVVHVLACFSMALMLIPGMPGLGTTAESTRIGYIAAHPWWWHIGWFPWHLCALSDLFLSHALALAKWVPKLPARLTLVLTILAVAVEQPFETMWDVQGPSFAATAIESGNLAIYQDFEKIMFLPVCAIAAVLYSLMAMGWSWCISYCGKWTTFLTWLSIVTWSILLVMGPAPLLPPPYNLPPLLLTVGNALGFNLMALWFVFATEAILRRTRVAASHGRMADWKLPRTDVIGKCLTVIGNSRFLKFLGEQFPGLALVSDIEDVVYINYLVDAERLQPLVPEGLQLQTLGSKHQYALFSILTYKHGHFGPRLFGPLRKLMPSPVQSNWRIHVTDPNTGISGIYFIYTAVSNLLVALGGRTLSDGVPMHVPAKSMVSVEVPFGNGETATVGRAAKIEVVIEPGSGSSPDLVAHLVPGVAETDMTGHWFDCFMTYEGFLSYCVPQDRAMSSQPWYQRITTQEIHLGIPISACQHLEGKVQSNTIEKLLGNAEPVCFLVPKVNFLFEKVKVYQLVEKST